MRRVLGDFSDEALQSEEGRLALKAETFTCDISNFEKHTKGDTLDELKTAANLYQADFLEGLDGISSPFDQWIATERTRLQNTAIEMFLKLIDLYEGDGKTTEAISSAQRIVDIDPANEDGHYHLIRLFLAEGRRSTAARQFEICEKAVREQLDAEPGQKIKELMAAMDPEPVPAKPEKTSEIQSPSVNSPAQSKGAPIAGRSADSRRKGFSVLLTALIVITLLAFWPGKLSFWDDRDKIETSEAPPKEADCQSLYSHASGSTPSLLLLPTQTVSTDDFGALFAAATTESVQSLTSSVSGFEMIRGPGENHPHRNLTLTELAHRNNATHVFQTSIVDAPTGHRITLRIVDGATGRQVWQDSISAKNLKADPGRLQMEIALAAARGIQEHLTEGKQALLHYQYEPESISLFEHTTRGFGLLEKADPVLNQMARNEFTSALAISSKNASANTGLGFTYITPLIFRWNDADNTSLIKAKEHADVSISADPSYAPAYYLKALTNLFEGNHKAARETIAEGLNRSGGGADATAFAGFIFSFLKDPAQSVDAAAHAMKLRPYSSPVWYQWSFARALRITGNTEGAITCLKEIDYKQQGIVAPAIELVLAYEATNRIEEARPLANLILERTNNRFSSNSYCRSPQYESKRATRRCIKALTRAGLPN